MSTSRVTCGCYIKEMCRNARYAGMPVRNDLAYAKGATCDPAGRTELRPIRRRGKRTQPYHKYCVLHCTTLGFICSLSVRLHLRLTRAPLSKRHCPQHSFVAAN